MHIGIDVQEIVGKTGVKRYVYNLVAALATMDRQNKYTLFFNSLRNKPRLPSFNNGNFELSIEKFPPHLRSPLIVREIVEKIRFRLFLPRILQKKQIDVFHVPFEHNILACSSALKQGIRTVLTIHDLIPFFFNSTFDPRTTRRYIYNLRLLGKKVDAIIVISLNTKNDVMKLLHVEPEKIKVIYEGVDERFMPIQNKAALLEIRDKYRIDDNFILYIGLLHPRKTFNLIRGYYELRHTDNLRCKLVIVGEKKLAYRDMLNTIRKLRIKNDVVFIGYVPDQDIVLLLNAANLFVYPSLYEGLGLPPLEAMACGTPVVTSNVSSMPEVVGDAAILVNPNSVRELANAMYEGLTNSALRKKLIDRGLRRAKLFRWQETARKTLEVYQAVLRKP